jgi:DNA-binding XRE family transcriptional regulator
MDKQQAPSAGSVKPVLNRGDLPTPRSIGWNLRLGRKSRHLTLLDVAKGAGITVSALSRIETGHKTPSLETLVRICDVAGIGIGEVFQRPEVWVGPTVALPGRKGSRVGLVRLSRPNETRVGVFHGELPPGRSGTLKGPVKGGIVFFTAKAGVSFVGHEGEHYALQCGDSLTVMAPGRIRWTNGSPVPARALWVYTPHPELPGSLFREDPSRG